MEIRDAKLQLNKAGGTSGKGTIKYKAQIPIPWIRDMGLGEDDRDIELIYDEETREITIRKKVVHCSRCGFSMEYQLTSEDLDGTAHKYYKCSSCGKCFRHTYQKNELIEEQEVDCSETYIF